MTSFLSLCICASCLPLEARPNGFSRAERIKEGGLELKKSLIKNLHFSFIPARYLLYISSPWPLQRGAACLPQAGTTPKIRNNNKFILTEILMKVF